MSWVKVLKEHLVGTKPNVHLCCFCCKNLIKPKKYFKLSHDIMFRDIGVQSPVGTDLLVSLSLGNMFECHGSSEMTIING